MASVAAAIVGLSAAYVFDLSDYSTFHRILHDKQSSSGPLQHSGAFVKFWAPWCPHCKAMAPDWKQVEDAYESSTALLVGSVDCSEGRRNTLCDLHKATSLPTLKFFELPDKKGTIYHGNLTVAGGLLDFAHSLASGCSRESQDPFPHSDGHVA